MDQLANLRSAITNCEARLASIALQERIVVAHPESVRDPSYVHSLMKEKLNLQKKLKELKQVEKTLVSREATAAAFCSRLAQRAHLEAEALKLERRKTRRGKKPSEKIIDRDREMARLAFEDKPIEVIAIHLDDLEFSTPKTWKKPKYAPKGEKYTTGIRVPKLRQSFLQMVSRAKKKYPAPAPS